jgi:S-adenosylmethionine/arginine decarboxylase-like enzyme
MQAIDPSFGVHLYTVVYTAQSKVLTQLKNLKPPLANVALKDELTVVDGVFHRYTQAWFGQAITAMIDERPQLTAADVARINSMLSSLKTYANAQVVEIHSVKPSPYANPELYERIWRSINGAIGQVQVDRKADLTWAGFAHNIIGAIKPDDGQRNSLAHPLELKNGAHSGSMIARINSSLPNVAAAATSVVVAVGMFGIAKIFHTRKQRRDEQRLLHQAKKKEDEKGRPGAPRMSFQVLTADVDAARRSAEAAQFAQKRAELAAEDAKAAVAAAEEEPEPAAHAVDEMVHPVAGVGVGPSRFADQILGSNLIQPSAGPKRK